MRPCHLSHHVLAILGLNQQLTADHFVLTADRCAPEASELTFRFAA